VNVGKLAVYLCFHDASWQVKRIGPAFTLLNGTFFDEQFHLNLVYEMFEPNYDKFQGNTS